MFQGISSSTLTGNRICLNTAAPRTAWPSNTLATSALPATGGSTPTAPTPTTSSANTVGHLFMHTGNLYCCLDHGVCSGTHLLFVIRGELAKRTEFKLPQKPPMRKILYCWIRFTKDQHEATPGRSVNP